MVGKYVKDPSLKLVGLFVDLNVAQLLLSSPSFL